MRQPPPPPTRHPNTDLLICVPSPTWLTPPVPEQGDAKSDLCDRADEVDADLLIVAASSAQGLRKTFGTSTSTYLVHHAPCPTLVIPVHIALAGLEDVASPQESRELRGGAWGLGVRVEGSHEHTLQSVTARRAGP